MTLYGKDAGTIQTISQPYAKVSSTWTAMSEVWAKAAGSWNKIWPTFISPTGPYATWQGTGVTVEKTLAIDPATGDVYLARGTSINKIPFSSYSAGGTPISNWAGSYGSTGSTNATGNAARFFVIQDMCFGADGNLYVLEENRIRKVTMGAVVTNLAGPTTTATGYTDATGTAARFKGARGICSYGGDLYVTDTSNNVIRKIALTGFVTTQRTGVTATNGGLVTDGTYFYYPKTTLIFDKIGFSSGSQTLFAGSTSGRLDGTGGAAQFTNIVNSYPVLHPNGNFYVSDKSATSKQGWFIEITPGGVVTTLATIGPGTTRTWTGKAVQADGSILAACTWSGSNRIHVFT